ncbi:MAG: SDR family oxidoreductase [Mycobacteriales bacterium]
MLRMDRVEGVALVTGSSSGIGAAVARRLAAAGMTVVVNSHSAVDAGEALAAEIGGSYLQADIGDGTDARRLVERTVERHGRLDLLVNNAGTTTEVAHADLAGATDEIWRHIFEVNVLGTWHVTTAAVDHLRSAGAGHVVNVTSLGGQRPLGSSIPYAVSKAAVDHLTRLLASALGPEIRVNAVAPGFVDTPWTSAWTQLRDTVSARVPLRRPGSPEDIADAILGLHRATYVTGQVLAVDGGLHLR